MRYKDKRTDLLQNKREATERHNDFSSYVRSVQDSPPSYRYDDFTGSQRYPDQQNRMKDQENLRR